MTKFRLLLTAMLIALGLTIPATVSAAPIPNPNTNSAAYWETQFPGTSCWKHDPPQDGGVHGYLTGSEPTAVVLNQFSSSWTGYSGWAALIVNGGNADAVYTNPTPGVAYYAPLNGGEQVPNVSHWIVCKTITVEVTPTATHQNNVSPIECGDTEWSATVTVTVTDTSWNLGWSSDGVAWQQVTNLAPGSYTITFGPYPADDRFVQINVYAWWEGGSYDTNREGRNWDALEPTHNGCPDTTVPDDTVPPTTEAPTTTVPDTTTPTTTTTTTKAPQVTTTTLVPVPHVTTTTLAPKYPQHLPTTGASINTILVIALGVVLLGALAVFEERRARRARTNHEYEPFT